LEKEINIVKHLTGVKDDSRISTNETGWTSRVYIVDNGKFVFKFPRNEKFKKECIQEVAVLQLLKNHKFNASTPVLNWTVEDNSYFGFYGVEGKPLREVIRTISNEQKLDIGTQLGVFVKQLHGIKDYSDVKSQTLDEQATEYSRMYRKGRGSLDVIFGQSELMIIDDFFEHEVPKSMTGVSELVFCHGDLDYNNTLIDADNHVGIIDFGDAGLYDRSQDFRGMDDVALREAMIMAYGGGDIISRAASETTSKMIDVLNLIYCIESREAEASEYIERIKLRFFDKEL